MFFLRLEDAWEKLSFEVRDQVSTVEKFAKAKISDLEKLSQNILAELVGFDFNFIFYSIL